MDAPQLDRNRPQETDTEDETDGLREEYSCLLHPGHARRLAWIMFEFRQDADRLAFGDIKDDRERHQAEGRCQAFKKFIERDRQTQESWERLLSEEEEKKQPDELEGGDLGIGYEAAQ